MGWGEMLRAVRMIVRAAKVLWAVGVRSKTSPAKLADFDFFAQQPTTTPLKVQVALASEPTMVGGRH